MTAPFDLSVTDELLSTTRAVRKRLDLERPVPPEVILDCLRLATQAPTGSNSQGWRFLVVTDPAKRAKLAEFYRSGGEDYLAASADVPRDEQGTRVRSSAEYLVDIIDKVPVLVIPCLLGRITDISQAAGFFGSIHPAIWSFQLALRSRGLGSVWTTFHLAHERETAALLGIPDSVTQAAMLPVAWTKGTDFRPATRRPIEEITYLDSWKHTASS
ncbi:nitroreductase [Nakamurella sp. YIM 132087]|uniref:Nitroreductase n=1 Tax=Nakamurella alba TaxID=2665158 RepID=A0A7K1FVB1_9ACTN|nr:nitroreductase family protein [Nakamurella alba]MTD17309.1 nitroreductase [Nakamurella alba]